MREILPACAAGNLHAGFGKSLGKSVKDNDMAMMTAEIDFIIKRNEYSGQVLFLDDPLFKHREQLESFRLRVKGKKIASRSGDAIELSVQSSHAQYSFADGGSADLPDCFQPVRRHGVIFGKLSPVCAFLFIEHCLIFCQVILIQCAFAAAGRAEIELPVIRQYKGPAFLSSLAKGI